MQRAIIISLTLFFSIDLASYSQVSLNDSLLFYEYQYYKSDNDSVKQNILIKKIDLYLNAGITNTNVFNEVKRVNVNHLSYSQADFLWNASLIAYLNAENSYAAFFLNEYNNVTRDSSTSALLLKILIYKYTDTNLTRRAINQISSNDTIFFRLSCFKNIVSYNRKHLNFYLISSAIIPGSGSVLNGYVLKGVFSLALVSASALAIVEMVKYGLYLNAVLWGTGIGLKFYAGNINLTEKLFYKRETNRKNKLSQACECHLNNILAKYPITLRQK